jgi:hypothetical protein
MSRICDRFKVDESVILAEFPVFLMEWPPTPAFVAKVQGELFPELPLSGESLLIVLEWIKENIYDTGNGNAAPVSPGERIFSAQRVNLYRVQTSPPSSGGVVSFLEGKQKRCDRSATEPG